MADKEFTYSDVSEHTTKKDLFLVVHDKVYNASSFVDEHPWVSPVQRCATSLQFPGIQLESFQRTLSPWPWIRPHTPKA